MPVTIYRKEPNRIRQEVEERGIVFSPTRTLGS
jgi:hypothetical protein